MQSNTIYATQEVHDWDDDRAVTIPRNCRQAMPATGRLPLLETVLPGNDSLHFGKILDLNMLAMSSGRERTRAQFCTLFKAAGLKVARIVPDDGPTELDRSGATIETIKNRKAP